MLFRSLLVVMLICSKYNAKYVVVLCIVQMHRLLLLTVSGELIFFKVGFLFSGMGWCFLE